MVVDRGWGAGDGELLFSGDRDSVSEDNKGTYLVAQWLRICLPM